MKSILVMILCAVVSMAFLPATSRANGLPLVINATVDYNHGTLTIGGQNFGSNPVVTLNNLSFPTVSAASNQIVANFPSGQPPSSFAPGTYFLLVTYKNQLPTVFEVAIGAEVEVPEVEVQAALFAVVLEDAGGLGDDFGADAVAGENGDEVRGGHLRRSVERRARAGYAMRARSKSSYPERAQRVRPTAL